MVAARQPAFEEFDCIQSICRESFYEFVQEFWDELIPETPIWNWHIKFLCNELQHMAERVFLRLPKEDDIIVNIPPGTTKSTICSIMFPAWMWTRDPTIRTISASYEHNLALNFARRSRDLILCEKYQAAFRFKQNDAGKWLPSTDPDAVPITLRDDQNAKGFYENMAKGDRKAVGAGGNITGSHGHVIIVDDPLNPKEAVSEAGLKTINKWMDETLPSRKVDKAVSPTLLIMQRLHQDDPTGHWLAKKKKALKWICLPDRLRDNVRPRRLRAHYKRNGGLLDPVRLSDAVLEDQLQELGKYGYAGQYEQSPVPLGEGMFEVEKIQFLHPPKMVDIIDIIRYWDKAGTKDAGANSAGVKIGIDRQRRIWILDVVKGQWSIARRNAIMHSTAESDGHAVKIGVEQEPGSGGKESAEISVIQVFPGYRVTLDRPTGDKVTRAEPLAGQMGVGNVCVPVGAPWWDDVKNEFMFFPFGIRKDVVDAASAGYNLIAGAGVRMGVL